MNLCKIHSGLIHNFIGILRTILKELFKSGIRLGISSRGMGSVESVNESGAQEVQDDFELIAFDFVSNPSTHGAFMNPVSLSEGKIKVSKFNKISPCKFLEPVTISPLTIIFPSNSKVTCSPS